MLGFNLSSTVGGPLYQKLNFSVPRPAKQVTLPPVPRIWNRFMAMAIVMAYRFTKSSFTLTVYGKHLEDGINNKRLHLFTVFPFRH